MDRAILISIFSFVFGIFVSSFVLISPIVSLFLILIGFAVLAAEKVWEGRVKWEVIIISIAFISFSLGSLRYAIKDFHNLQSAGGPTSEGVVVSEPEQRENATRFVLKLDNGEKVLVSTDLYSPVQYGDRVVVQGKFGRPEVFDGFDYPAYLAKDDIYQTMSFAKVEVLSSDHGHSVKSALLKIKKSFLNKIKETFAEPYASLLSGLILAGKDAMPKDMLETFRIAGIIHIVVLSGYNITIIAEFLRRTFRNNWLSIAGIVAFVLMTGAEATVVRAAIMVLTVILARMLHRKYSAPRALLLAGAIMLVENPKILVYDPSFQLSFLATLGLIYIVPVVERYLEFLPNKYGIKNIVSTTIGTQLAVLPLLIYSVGDVSLVSLPANILVLIVISQTMLIGFITTVLAYINVFLALPLAYITQLFLWWIISVAEFFGNMSFASVAIPGLPFWSVVLAYVAISILVWSFRNSFLLSSNSN